MQIIKGNIFTTKHQTIVNTINCVGVMGAGIALEFKLRYPTMFNTYVNYCESNIIDIGKLWIYKHSKSKWVLNFPTKLHWKYPTKIEYLEKGLIKFVQTYKSKGITSIAFPVLGANKGGLTEDTSLEIMKKYLSKCDIPIDIYKYDPSAYDDLFASFKKKILLLDSNELSILSGIKLNYIKKIKLNLENSNINSISMLASTKGIGITTLEKAFKFSMDEKLNNDNLFSTL